MKYFLKNLSFGVDGKLYFPPLTYKINAHNMSGVRSKIYYVQIFNQSAMYNTF